MLLSDEQLSSMNRFTSRSGLSKLVDILLVEVNSGWGNDGNGLATATPSTFVTLSEVVADGV